MDEHSHIYIPNQKALKDMQYAQPEYADAEWHSRIQTIAPRVRERLAALDEQEQESS